MKSSVVVVVLLSEKSHTIFDNWILHDSIVYMCFQLFAMFELNRSMFVFFFI
jgi:hypothetical protein